MQLVNLLEDGRVVQFSKRKGEFVTLDELIDDIGVDAARFFMLQRSHDTTLDLDLKLAREQSQENPVYYVQYAHARIASILRKAGEARVEEAVAADLAGGGRELHPSASALLKQLLEFPEEVRLAAERRAPHRMTAYSLEVARSFSAFYRDCQVVGGRGRGLPHRAERAGRRVIAQVARPARGRGAGVDVTALASRGRAGRERLARTAAAAPHSPLIPFSPALFSHELSCVSWSV